MFLEIIMYKYMDWGQPLCVCSDISYLFMHEINNDCSRLQIYNNIKSSVFCNST